MLPSVYDIIPREGSYINPESRHVNLEYKPYQGFMIDGQQVWESRHDMPIGLSGLKQYAIQKGPNRKNNKANAVLLTRNGIVTTLVMKEWLQGVSAGDGLKEVEWLIGVKFKSLQSSSSPSALEELTEHAHAHKRENGSLSCSVAGAQIRSRDDTFMGTPLEETHAHLVLTGVESRAQEVALLAGLGYAALLANRYNRRSE